MERTYQIVGERGIQIPLPLLEPYGFNSGTRIVVEVGRDGVFIQSVKLSRSEITQHALRLLFRRLGDAVLVKVEPDDGDASHPEPHEWLVTVYGRGNDTPLGTLRYSQGGELLTDADSAIARMWEKARQLAA